jgi:hypothetical protein
MLLLLKWQPEPVCAKTNPFSWAALHSKKRSHFFRFSLGKRDLKSHFDTAGFRRGRQGLRTYRPRRCRYCSAASMFEPHRSASIGHAGWRGRLLHAFVALVLWYLAPNKRPFAGRGCYRIDPKVFRPGASRGVRPARKSSTAVMRRSLRREITVRKRHGVQRLPGWSRTRASGSPRCWVSK